METIQLLIIFEHHKVTVMFGSILLHSLTFNFLYSFKLKMLKMHLIGLHMYLATYLAFPI